MLSFTLISQILDQYYQGEQSSSGHHTTAQQHHTTTSQHEYSSSKVEYSCTPPPSEFCVPPPPAHQDQVLALTTTTTTNSRLPHTPTPPFRGNISEPPQAAGTVLPVQVDATMMIYRSSNSRVKDESPVLDMSGWVGARQTSSGPNTPHYTSYRATSNLHAHCHPQQLHGSPPPPSLMPPLNLDANEALKVERKRARNRVAASKCRMRKIEKIATLDQQAEALRKVCAILCFAH